MEKNFKLVCSKCGRPWPQDESGKSTASCKCGAGVKYKDFVRR